MKSILLCMLSLASLSAFATGTCVHTTKLCEDTLPLCLDYGTVKGTVYQVSNFIECRDYAKKTAEFNLNFDNGIVKIKKTITRVTFTDESGRKTIERFELKK